MSHHIQLSYTLHERTPNGYQWTWRASELKESLLDDFLYRIQYPDDASNIRPEELCGGILKFAQVNETEVDEHVVFYRFYNGGNDEGRSRVTMLAAWTTIDQFPSSQAANGVLDLFQNKMFKYVSDNACTINIEQPFSLIDNETLPVLPTKSSAALEDFLCGLTDENHDYSLKIQNDNQTVQKKPSAAFEYKKAEAAKREREDDQRKANKIKQEAEERKGLERVSETAALSAQKQKHQQDRLAKEERLQQKKDNLSGSPWLYAKVVSCIVIVIIYSICLSSSNSPKLSPAARNVVDGFEKLSPPEQQKVHIEINKIMDSHTQGLAQNSNEKSTQSKQHSPGQSPVKNNNPSQEKPRQKHSGDSQGQSQNSNEKSNQLKQPSQPSKPVENSHAPQ